MGHLRFYETFQMGLCELLFSWLRFGGFHSVGTVGGLVSMVRLSVSLDVWVHTVL